MRAKRIVLLLIVAGLISVVISVGSLLYRQPIKYADFEADRFGFPYYWIEHVKVNFAGRADYWSIQTSNLAMNIVLFFLVSIVVLSLSLVWKEHARRMIARRKKLENGTKRTRVLMSNLWSAKKIGEENAGTHRKLAEFFEWKVLKVEGGELQDKKGSRQLSRYRRTRSNWLPIVLATMVFFTIFLIIPIFKETDIHIQIGYSDDIQNVWVDTPSKSLISGLFSPSYPLGAYVLNVSITVVSQSIANFSRINVPIGEYVIVWQSNVPDHGFYTIKVDLYKLQVLKSTYSINISF